MTCARPILVALLAALAAHASLLAEGRHAGPASGSVDLAVVLDVPRSPEGGASEGAGAPLAGEVVSFRLRPAGGALLLLAARGRLLEFDGAGRLLRDVVLRWRGNLLAETARIVDFDADGDGGLYVLDQAAGTVFCARADGTVIGRVGLFLHGTRVEVSSNRICVTDEGTSSVSVFDRGGGLVGYRRGRGWSPCLLAEDRLVGVGRRNRALVAVAARLVGSDEAEGSPGPRPAALGRFDLPAGDAAVRGRVLGVDRRGRVHVLAMARPDDRGGTRRVIEYGAAGEAAASHVLPPPSADPALGEPPLRLAPDGSVLSLERTDAGFRLVRLGPANG